MDSLGAQLTRAAPREAQRWGYGGMYQQQISTIKTWVANRLNFIDTNLLNAPVLSSNWRRHPLRPHPDPHRPDARAQ